MLNNGARTFEVSFGNHGFIVHLAKKTCICRLWQLSGIPCCHSIAAIYFVGDNPDKYVSSWLTVEASLMAYEGALQPVNGEGLWPKTTCEPVLPPTNVRKHGRPKRCRRKEVNEEKGVKVWKNQPEIFRKGRQMKCTNCGGIDHSSRGCKNQRVEDDPHLNIRRKNKPTTAANPSSLVYQATAAATPSTDRHVDASS